MEQFFAKFVEYAENTFSHVSGLYFFLGSLILLYILLLALLSASKERNSILKIYRTVYISSFIVITILLIVAISLWNFSDFFESKRIQFVFFLTEIVLLVFPIVYLGILANHYHRSKLHKLTGISYSIRERDKFYSRAKKSFSRAKFFLLLPLAAFLLLLIKNPNPALLSIVIDNSDSMTDIEQVKNAITGPMRSIEDNTSITLGYLEICETPEESQRMYTQYKDDPWEITETRIFEELRGEVEYFSNPYSAVQFIDNTLDLNNSLTPLYESLWKHYLYIKDVLPPGQDYKKKLLVVATDGQGLLTEKYYPGAGGPNSFNVFNIAADDGLTMNTYYDEIALINFGDSDEAFWYSQPRNSIYRGQSPASIEQAMAGITGKVSVDWNFIILMAIPLFITMFVLLFITPKKM